MVNSSIDVINQYLEQQKVEKSYFTEGTLKTLLNLGRSENFLLRLI